VENPREAPKDPKNRGTQESASCKILIINELCRCSLTEAGRVRKGCGNALPDPCTGLPQRALSVLPTREAEADLAADVPHGACEIRGQWLDSRVDCLA